MTMPIRTNMTIAPCSQIHVGDIARQPSGGRPPQMLALAVRAEPAQYWKTLTRKPRVPNTPGKAIA